MAINLYDLDNIAVASARAQYAIYQQAVLLRQELDVGPGGQPYINNINNWAMWLAGANSTALPDALRIRLLTLLVNVAKLNQIPTPSIYGFVQPISSTVVGTIAWDQITGLPNSNPSLVAYVNGKIVFVADPTIVLGQIGGHSKTFGKYVNGDVAPWTGLTFGEAMLDAITEYLAPEFLTFIISGQATTVEVGTTIASGASGGTPVNVTFQWTTSNPTNIRVSPGPITIQDATTEVDLVTNTANDGAQVVGLVTPIPMLTATSHVWTIIGFDTNGDNFELSFTVNSRYYNFSGTSASAPTTSANVRAGSSSFADSFTIVTGTTNLYFWVWVRTGKTLTSVIDTDALDLEIIGDFATSSLAVNDAAGTPVNGTLYLKTNGVPFSTSHHLVCTVV